MILTLTDGTARIIHVNLYYLAAVTRDNREPSVFGQYAVHFAGGTHHRIDEGSYKRLVNALEEIE